MAAALLGLVMIGLTVGHGLTAGGLILTLASALSWSVGNVLLKRLPKVQRFNLMVWLSLIPPLPALALSIVLDGSLSLPHALLQLHGLASPGRFTSAFLRPSWPRAVGLFAESSPDCPGGAA